MATKKPLFLTPDQIEPKEGFNPRFDFGDMKSLEESIKAHGVLQPLTVFKTKKKLNGVDPIYQLVDGHRRHKALTKIALTSEEALVVECREIDAPADELDLLVHVFATGSTSQPLNLLEKADVVGRYVTAGYKIKAIADALSVSKTHIADLLIIVEKATPALRKQVMQGKLSATNMLEFIRNTAPDQVEDLVDEALAATGKEKVSRKDIIKAAGKDITAKKKAKDVDAIFDDEDEDLEVVEKVRGTREVSELQQLKDLQEVLLMQEDRTPNDEAFSLLRNLIDMLDPNTETEMGDLLNHFFHDAKPKEVIVTKKSRKASTEKPKKIYEAEAELDEFEEAEAEAPKAPAKKAKAIKQAPVTEPILEDDEDEDLLLSEDDDDAAFDDDDF